MKLNLMKRLGFTAFALAALCAVPSVSFAQEDAAAQLAVTQAASSVDVTVYADGFGQVEEQRQVKLSAGKNRIQLNGIAAKYRLDSLSIVNTSGPGAFKFKSATYQPANLTAERVLEQSIGKQVTATVGTGATARQVTGTLVSVRNGQVIITTSGGATHLASPSDIELGALNASLSNTASLVIEADVATAGTYTLHFLYETDGLGWSAKHTLVYDQDKSKVDSFNSTVNVINNSGTSFENANLWLLSGSVRDQKGGMRLRSAEYAAPAAAMADAAPVESVGERKVYRIPGRVSVGDGQSRQLPLFSGANVAVEHEYYVPAAQYYDASTGATPVSVRLKLKNCVEHNLGTPLPAGAVKVLQRNSEGKLQLTANAYVKDLAKDEAFDIGLGTSSDVKAERVLASTKDIVGPAPRVQPGQPAQQAPEYQDQTFEVKVFNFKDKKAVDVLVEVALPGEQDNIAPLTKKTATLATSTVHVDAGKNETLKYTLRIRTR